MAIHCLTGRRNPQQVGITVNYQLHAGAAEIGASRSSKDIGDDTPCRFLKL
jgi:hypothetical protein